MLPQNEHTKRSVVDKSNRGEEHHSKEESQPGTITHELKNVHIRLS